jgi:hypothetical protein
MKVAVYPVTTAPDTPIIYSARQRLEQYQGGAVEVNGLVSLSEVKMIARILSTRYGIIMKQES